MPAQTRTPDDSTVTLPSNSEIYAFGGVVSRKGLSYALHRAPYWVPDPFNLHHEPGEFYGGNVDLHYGTSWLLVHWLLHGDGGRYAERFTQFIETERNGADERPDLLRILGIDPLGLDAALRSHAKNMRFR